MRMKREDVIDVMRGCRYGGEAAITALTEKCLIKIREDEKIWMHDQVRDMGRQIVVEKNLVDPGMRSRLWDRSEILAVLKNLKVSKEGSYNPNTAFAKKNSAFYRKGNSGDWKNYLTEEMGARLDQIVEQKLNGSGFSFLFRQLSD